jgi:uncharacterized repeat protein (TIGR03803 family)
MRKTEFAKLSLLTLVICFAVVIHAPAQTFTSLASFSGGNGSGPAAGVVQGLDGNFYGTTVEEGIGSEGNVYKVSPSATLTNLFNFCSTGCADGEFPFGGLVLATNGAFYGTTQGGGVALEGTVYKVTSSGTETALYSFCLTDCSDGLNPSSALIQVGNSLYGTTTSTIFKVTLSGALTTLFNFCVPNCVQNGPPFPSGLVQGSDGNFYGTSSAGGTNNVGTVFQMTPSAVVNTLHSFTGADGSNPPSSLVQGPNGSLYGVTFSGGNSSSCGTIFRITHGGSFKTVHTFSGKDGCNPESALILATDGNLYGTTRNGGTITAGTVFQITPSGKLTTLYNFCQQNGCLDGEGPQGALLEATNGTFYGTTSQGGTDSDGTIFSLSMGLGPFVETLPTSGKIGANVIILGNSLTGASSVTFDGTAATFSVVSDTEITATVPAGASTGTVQVSTPSGTLSSNVAFRVMK